MRLTLALGGLLGCLAVVLVLTLSPTPVDQGYEAAVDRVLSVMHRNGVPGWFGYRWLEFTANICLFLPVGFFLALVFPTRFLWIALPAVTALSATLETLQFFVLPARFATLTDVLANSIGGWAGVTIAAFIVTAVHERDRRLQQKWRSQLVVRAQEPVA
ncbi:VanZ family protein [Microbacterium sp. 1P10AE]|uniref:VanZ family protein n=1 Tax=Microbacterium sp. 1P10AE TaxID=3132286 RepID=UPI00399F5E28